MKVLEDVYDPPRALLVSKFLRRTTCPNLASKGKDKAYPRDIIYSG